MRAWEDFLLQQEKELGKEIINKWVRPLQVIRFDACNLYLESPDSFKVTWFEEHLRPKVLHSLYNNNQKPIRVHLSLASPPPDSSPAETASATAPLSPFILRFDEADPQAQFSNFLSTPGNLLAYKLFQECCGLEEQRIGERTPPLSLPVPFNPLYVFGRSGTGKTHLLMATASQLQKTGYKALYVRAETFTEHVVHAIRTGEMQTFRKAYRHADVLLLDGVEVLSRKAATQEEFFHTFNTLHSQGKQIIISAQCPPQELKFIEPRLISRFEWGIVVPLQMLGREEMRTVLNNRAEALSFSLEESLSAFLLDTFGGSTKALIRALEALVLRTHLHHTQAPLTVKLAQHYLTDLIQEEERALLTPGKIIRTVADFYGIRMEDILSKSQTSECVLPRQIAMHLCREELRLPFVKIGDIFSRDHSTVISSVRRIQKGLESKDPSLLPAFKEILSLLH